MSALNQGLSALALGDVDEAAVELARTYAGAIDDGGPLDVLGPKLLAVLDSLGLTPKARAAQKGGADDKPTSSPLDQLRERRRARQRDTTDLDATPAGVDA